MQLSLHVWLVDILLEFQVEGLSVFPLLSGQFCLVGIETILVGAAALGIR